MEYPKTRKEAKALGATHYFTGEPCVRGHVSPRKTKGACVECVREGWTADNERRKSRPKSDASKAAGRRYYEKNRDLVISRAASRSAEVSREYRRVWKRNNPEHTQVSVNVRRRRLRDASPSWLTQAQKFQIREMYLAARRLTRDTGIKHVVDHIVPLRSDEVCGLHVPWNLQILTHIENSVKGNRL